MSEQQRMDDTAVAAEGRCPACFEPRPDLSVPCANCGAPALGPADPSGATADGRRTDPMMQVRASDLEPYVGLRYLSKLFRLIAILLVLVLVVEVVTALVRYGPTTVLPALIGEASRLIVFAALSWGFGDLAILLIDIGHDIRASRILLGRQAVHHMTEHHQDRGRDLGAELPVATGADAARGARGEPRRGAR